MTSFAETQQALQDYIVAGDLRAATLIDATTAAPAALRLRVYSDAYRLRLIEALAANYPSMEKLLGEAPFARLAQIYLAVYPSRHYSIRWFGDRLADFLREHADYRDSPWLAELADWEWRIATAFDAEDHSSLTLEMLASLPPNAWPEVSFTFHPSVQPISLTTNVVPIVKALAVDDTPPTPCALQLPGVWLIWRLDLEVQYRSLDAMEAAALNSAMNGATFGELCEALMAHVETDAVPGKAASLVKTWISEGLLVAPPIDR